MTVPFAIIKKSSTEDILTGFGTTRGWVDDDRILIFGWIIPLGVQLC